MSTAAPVLERPRPPGVSAPRPAAGGGTPPLEPPEDGGGGGRGDGEPDDDGAGEARHGETRTPVAIWIIAAAAALAVPAGFLVAALTHGGL